MVPEMTARRGLCVSTSDKLGLRGLGGTDRVANNGVFRVRHYKVLLNQRWSERSLRDPYSDSRHRRDKELYLIRATANYLDLLISYEARRMAICK